ncbi:MAG: putative DNA-binding domain-containing protein [Gammaproteobacteria bacterium]|nr:putative DNA-binding domain-containing protein [Gammaproteobacteria bacterium]
MPKSSSARKELPKFQQIQYDFAGHLRDPEGVDKPAEIEDRRMKVYRDLFYNNIENFCSNSFPILRGLYNDQSWHQLVREFYINYRAHSPYFRDISKAFLDYLTDHREPQAGDYAFLQELAHWEWMELNALSDTGDILKFPHDRNGDLYQQKVVVSPLAWPLVYQYPVHRIGDAYVPTDAPELPTFLIISRNREHQVDFMETNAITYRLLEIFQEAETEKEIQLTGEEAIAQLQTETQFPEPQQLIDGGKQILQDFLQRDVILGVNL